MFTRLDRDGLVDQVLLPPPGHCQTETGDGGPQRSLMESLGWHKQLRENVFQIPGETEMVQPIFSPIFPFTGKPFTAQVVPE